MTIREEPAAVAAEFQEEFGAATPELALAQISGEEFFLSTEQVSADLMGDGSAPGALAALMADVWQFSADQGSVTVAPDQAVINAALDPQFLK
jgi:hypothetical protein